MKRYVCLLIVSFLNSTAYGSLASSMGAAGSFAVLAGTTVTNTGATIVNGDLGLWGGTSITGFPPGVVFGTVDDSDSSAMLAEQSLTTAYNVAVSQACGSGNDLTGQNLGEASF